MKKGEMRLEKYIGVNKWKWIQLNTNEIDTVTTNEQDGFVSDWLKHINKNRTNYLRVDGLGDEEKVLKGSIIYKQNTDDESDNKVLHFYLTTDLLVTIGLELSLLKNMNRKNLLQQINKTENAVEGFLILLGELMTDILIEIDQFEDELNQMIWNIRNRNGIDILELVFKRRHELLVWNSLLIPINELKMAIDEINFPGISKGDIFSYTCKRIERARVLLNEYEQEFESIINLEEVIASYRGNEIMKTLTVITTIFTPVMAFGALWGMNFQHMPELEWKFGYILAITLVTVSTLLLYGYLKMKGWTGDLLKGKKKNSFFK
jgi:magnesium transporter